MQVLVNFKKIAFTKTKLVKIIHVMELDSFKNKEKPLILLIYYFNNKTLKNSNTIISKYIFKNITIN